MSGDIPKSPSIADAVAALRSLSPKSADQLDGVLLVSETKGPSPMMSFLKPTVDGANAVVDITNQVSKHFEQLKVIDYGHATTTSDGQVMWMSLSEVPLLESILDSSRDFANLPEFDPAIMKIKNVGLAAIRTGPIATPTVFVQALGARQVVAKTSRTGFFVRKGVLDVEKNELILLQSNITALVVQGFVFFENRRNFQIIFGLLEELQAQAEDTLRAVTSKLAIQGFDQLLEAVRKNSNMIAKLESIRQKVNDFPKYKEALTMPQVLNFVRTHPLCKVQLSGDGDDAALVFQNDIQHQFKILNLLDDDYLRSDLTTMEYEANSKSSPLS